MNDQPAKKQYPYLFYIILIAGSAGVLFTLLRYIELYNTSLLYIGIPVFISVLAWIIALHLEATTRYVPSSITTTTMKSITVALLLSVVAFAEGIICIIFTAPIMYFIGFIIAYPIDRYRKKKLTKLQSSILPFLLVLLSLEGTHESLTFNRQHYTEYTTILSANVTAIRQELAKNPSIDKPAPWFLRIFPAPTRIEGSGINIGDFRKMHMEYHKWFFTNTVYGHTLFEITEATDDYIRYDTLEDTSYISNYLAMGATEISLTPIDENHTQVAVKISYERKLDPYWYFGPLQYIAVKLTAKTLIETIATPNS